mgnify:CR=1 FL=1
MVRLGQKTLMGTLSQGIENGIPVIIENIQLVVDAVLDDLTVTAALSDAGLASGAGMMSGPAGGPADGAGPPRRPCHRRARRPRPTSA